MDVVERVARAVEASETQWIGIDPGSPEWCRKVACAAIAALFDWMAEPSGNVIEAGYKAADDANEWENALIHWQAMLAEMRKEALGE